VGPILKQTSLGGERMKKVGIAVIALAVALGLAFGGGWIAYGLGQDASHADGYAEGKAAGRAEGYADGEEDGYERGSDAGYALGVADGEEQGALTAAERRRRAIRRWFEIGYAQGFADGGSAGTQSRPPEIPPPPYGAPPSPIPGLDLDYLYTKCVEAAEADAIERGTLGDSSHLQALEECEYLYGGGSE
jgi:hypothetical protein